MKKIIGLIGLASAALLAGCGGGGGSPGETFEQYKITLRADRTSLPINIDGYPAGIGVYAPYTTELHIDATEGSRPIPDAEDGAFACNVSSGLSSGALYYLDGDDEHEDEDGNPVAYRNITLGANAGGNSFHFHAGNQAGTSRITCTITDPRDNRIYSDSVEITVGAATGMASSIRAIASAPRYLGTQNNQNNLENSIAIQARVFDDANQLITDPGTANLQISIESTGGASTGARLVSGGQSGNIVRVNTTDGVGLFNLISGPNRGTILLRLVTDRADNDVTNGIQDPIISFLPVSVVHAVATEPLTLTVPSLSATNGVSFAYALEAEGGVPPYSWSITGSLPAGLSHANGVISGTPKAPPGPYAFVLRLSDDVGASVLANLTMNLSGELPPDPLSMSVSALTATQGEAFLRSFTVNGGDLEADLEFEAINLPPGFTADAVGNTAFIINPAVDVSACGTHTVLLIATRGSMSIAKETTLKVSGGSCP